MAIDKKAIEEKIRTVENDIANLKVDYDKYFIGLEAREPTEERKLVTQKLRDIDRLYFTNSVLKFKLASARTRFNTLCTHWDRIQKKIEDGTFERELVKLHKKEALEKETRKIEREGYNKYDAKHTLRLYNEMVENRTAKGDTLNGLNFDKFKANLRGKMDELETKYKDQPIKYQVYVEDGKLKIQIKKKFVRSASNDL
jgi:hypothetical protein